MSSAHLSLDAEVTRGRFDPDLAKCLRVYTIEMPPLRRHIEDVPSLAQHFLDFHNRHLGKRLTVSSDALSALRGYDWPGNVRELANLIERAAALADPAVQLDREDFILRLEELPPPEVPPSRSGDESVHEKEMPPSRSGGESVYEEIEREEGARLRAVLKQALGNKARAARLLGIARTTLNDRLRKYGVE
jgi:DNA-binding NtrC family response regulator